MKHYVLPNLVTHGPVSILLVGAGGTGSQIISGLARMNQTLIALGHGGIHLDVVDGDTVSASNVGRQLYSPADVGLNKALVQVTRMNNFFGTAWRAYPFSLEEKVKAERRYPIVISAVDSASARSVVARWGERNGSAYWLDTGNTATTGQAILGAFTKVAQPDGAAPVRLPHVLDLYGTIMKEEEKKSYQGPSCSVEDAIQKQDLFINQWVATSALEILWKIFRKGCLTVHGAFISLDPLSARSLPVDPDTWKAMGWTARRRRTKRRVSKDGPRSASRAA